MSESQRVIENMGVLNLSTVRDAASFADIAAIRNVGTVIIDELMADALAKIPMENVGSVAAIPSGANIKLFLGQTRIAGEAFAAAKEDEVWVIVGQVIITTVVEKFTGREIQVNGQVIAVRGSETVLSSAIGKLVGQILYLPAGSRNVFSSETWSREFLELLPEPTAFSILGQVVIEDEVTVDLLRAKVTEIVLMGEIIAPKALLPLLQVLAVEKYGDITIKG